MIQSKTTFTHILNMPWSHSSCVFPAGKSNEGQKLFMTLQQSNVETEKRRIQKTHRKTNNVKTNTCSKNSLT